MIHTKTTFELVLIQIFLNSVIFDNLIIENDEINLHGSHP